jgi:glycosyltransferase involved in cell wall biosynthesis
MIIDKSPDQLMKKIAIIGSQGIPSKYGGFETLAEYLTQYLSNDYDITVFCSSKVFKNRIKRYNNSNLKYIPFSANGSSSVLYDSISLVLSLNYDKILILGASSGLLMPILWPWKKKFVFNSGGIDWKRSKWSPFAKRVIKILERLAINNSGLIISDNQGIYDYIRQEYSKESVLIEYGGDQIYHIAPGINDYEKYPFLRGKYAFSVARIQPDNNINLILDSFVRCQDIPIVFVGNWNNSSYGLSLKKLYGNTSNIYLFDAIYDQKELNLLRSNCYIYIHGHSAGGTNPGLVEAMNLELPVLAFASGFNEYTTEGKALYFSSSEDLIKIMKSINDLKLTEIRKQMLKIAEKRYKWSIITKKYSNYL